MTRRFPVRPKTTFPKAVSGETVTFNMKPALIGTQRKTVPFPKFHRERPQTKPAILSFPVRAS